MQALAYTEQELTRLWREVKEDFWGDLKQQTLLRVKQLLEGCLQEQLAVYLNAQWHERSQEREGYRAGYYERDYLTEWGCIQRIRVPRPRKGPMVFTVWDRYERRQKEVNELVQRMFLAGISTRRVEATIKPLLGEGVSAQTVSTICQSLEREVKRWQERPLEDRYVYLILDGIVLKIRDGLVVRKRVVLCAYGITAEGQREFIGFRLAKAESQAAWEAFLNDLEQRGLKGKALVLIVTDGCPGLHAALDTVYPYVDRQHCWAHKLRNVAAKLPRKLQEAVLRGAKAIYQAESRKEAARQFWAWAKQWRGVVPRAVECLEKDLAELLHFFDCPVAHWKKIRTTNVIERAFREVRRRTRPMSSFTNPKSCQRIIYGIISYLNTKWEEHPLKHFAQPS
jgi:putative transposase